jgi:uncharacterized protein YbaP (TraB family)
MLRAETPHRARLLILPMLATLCCLLASCGSAATPQQGSDRGAGAAPVVVDPAPKHCLWRVDGGRSPVYLLGSIHFLRESDYPLPEAVQAAFGEAGVVAFEVEMDSIAGAAATMLAKGMLPADQKLSDVVSEATWQRVEAALEATGLPAAGFERMRPWMMALSLTSFELMRSGFDPKWGIDQYFWDRAGEAGVRRIGLETVDEQIELFASFDDREADDFLAYTLDELETVDDLMEQITADWKAGRLDRLEALYAESASEYPELLARLADDRNRAWLPVIETFAQGDETALVIVGTLHLVGDNGVPNLLRAAGYTVTQQ